MIGSESAKKVRHQRHIEDRHYSEVQCAASLARIAGQFLQEVFELPQNRARVFLKNQSARGEQDAFSPALKERDTKFRFEIAHLLRDAWLRNSQAIRRAA